MANYLPRLVTRAENNATSVLLSMRTAARGIVTIAGFLASLTAISQRLSTHRRHPTSNTATRTASGTRPRRWNSMGRQHCTCEIVGSMGAS